MPERFWRTVRKHGWWGAAYHEAIFRLADHAQSRAEQEDGWMPSADNPPTVTLPTKRLRGESFPLPLPGLDGSNPLAFLAALGTLRVCEQLAERADAPVWLKGDVRLSWGHGTSSQTPVLHLPDQPPSTDDVAADIGAQLARTVDVHPSAWAIAMLQAIVNDKDLALPSILRPRCLNGTKTDCIRLDWVNAFVCESAPDAASQLQTVRRDYLLGNFHAILARTSADHLARTLFRTWDYADALSNQSLHWEPTEDRRHAYQWHVPSGDPTRNKSGGMLGANRLALEAWPLFPCFPNRDKIATRGFTGTGMFNTFWTWPLWTAPWTSQTIASLLALPELQAKSICNATVRARGIAAVLRCQRILVGKTPNLTQAKVIG